MSKESKKVGIFNLGVNFKSADVSFRESLFVSEEILLEILDKIKKDYGIDELSVLSTCNRFEMYGTSTKTDITDAQLYEIYKAIQKGKDVNHDSLVENSYIYRNSTAVHHLISVASSLDSLVVVSVAQVATSRQNAIEICSLSTHKQL